MIETAAAKHGYSSPTRMVYYKHLNHVKGPKRFTPAFEDMVIFFKGGI